MQQSLRSLTTGKAKLTSPYSDDKAPKPLPNPPDMTLDMEKWPSLDDALHPSPGEVILSKYIRPGFINDFVLSLRGNETTTLMSIWGALFTVSSAVQRRAWLDWPPTRLYPNLYLIYIARPGVAKKSTAILHGASVVNMVRDLYTEEDDREIFSLPIWYGGTTPEFLFELLKPKEVMIRGGATGFDRPFLIGSRLAIIADELSEFLGKQKYNQGMISRLTSLYDCPSERRIGTVKHQVQEVKNVFINFFGGTTPDGFRDSIPAEAHGGGLMSRVVIVWQEEPTRQFSRPRLLDGAPNHEELARRLAWISNHKIGEFSMDAEATKLYDDWYEQWKTPEALGQISDSSTRDDILLVKTAMLLAASTYQTKQVITAADMQAALELTHIAYKQKRQVETTLLVENLWHDKMLAVKRFVSARSSVSRHELLRAVSNKMNSDDLNKVLDILQQSSQIQIIRDGAARTAPSVSGTETYIWRRDRDES